MRPHIRIVATSLGLALSIVFVVAQLPAQPRSPVLSYLQNVIKPILDSTLAELIPLQTAVSSIETDLGEAVANTSTVNTILDAQPTLHIVKNTFPTVENSSTSFNLDLAATPPADGGLQKLKRYTVSLRMLAPLFQVPTGIDRVRLITGVFDPTLPGTVDVDVANFDPVVTEGTLIAKPYMGSNSFIHVTRGADGLGPFEIVVNAYIESQP